MLLTIKGGTDEFLIHSTQPVPAHAADVNRARAVRVRSAGMERRRHAQATAPVSGGWSMVTKQTAHGISPQCSSRASAARSSGTGIAKWAAKKGGALEGREQARDLQEAGRE